MRRKPCVVTIVWLIGCAAASLGAEPPDGTVLYSSSFDGGIGAEWGALAGAFSAWDSDGDDVLDALHLTGGEACTLVFLGEQGCVPTAQGIPWDSSRLNDYEVSMHGQGGTADADVGIAVRGNRGAALTFQYINGNFQVLRATAGGAGGGGWSLGTNFGSAASFIPGFSVTAVHEYNVRVLDGAFEFRVDGVLIGTQVNPAVGGQTYDNSSTGTAGVAGWDAVIVLDFSAGFVAGGQPLPPQPSPRGLPILRQNAYDCADYYLYVPTVAVSDIPLPLVITSHSTVTTADQEIGLDCGSAWGCCEESPFPHTRWYELAENAGNVNGHYQPFIVAAPAMGSANGGLINPWTGESQAATDEQRILAIYDQITGHEAATYGFAVDAGRVLLTGWSGGGIPTYYTGVRHPDLFSMIVSRQGNFNEDMFDTAGDLSGRNYLPVAILAGSTDLIVPISVHQSASQFFAGHGYPDVFAPPADPHIRVLPDAEFPGVPSNHYCHSLVALDTFLDHMPPVAPRFALVDPLIDMARTGTEYHKQLVLLSVIEGPQTVNVDPTGLLSGWSPGVSDLGDAIVLQVRADNTIGSDTASWQVRVFSRSDFDADGDVDQEDFGAFQLCLSGQGEPYATGCGFADLGGDGDVDAADFEVFEACFNGPNNVPSG